MYKTDDDMLARATIETWVIKAERGERDCCPKCDGKVFEAEKMVTASVSIRIMQNEAKNHYRILSKIRPRENKPRFNNKPHIKL